MAVPIKMIAMVEGLSADQALEMADRAVFYAKSDIPKFWSARKRIKPLSGNGYYGITWSDSYLWFQDQGIKAFTMNSLKGKVIPMWVSDDDGSLKAKNPKIETRTREDGSQQVLIFRRATRPGAPGRISKRDELGRIAKGNVGVKWRHPGLGAKLFLEYGIHMAAIDGKLRVSKIVVFDDDGNENEI